MAQFKDGDVAYTTHRIIGTEVGENTRVTIIETYAEPRREAFYLVRTPGGFKVYAFETSLTRATPRVREEE